MGGRVIVNVASTQGYPTGQQRLRNSLLQHGNTPHIFWTNRLPEGSPTHEAEPYGFKLYAIDAALKNGFTTVLWVDAAVWAVRDLTPLFERIERDGHYFFHGGASLGQRCADSCLRLMGEVAIDGIPTLEEAREKAFQTQLIGGTVYGFDFTKPRIREFYDGWWDGLRIGAFRGAAINDIAQDNMCGLSGRPVGRVSNDPRVQGHCHDESVATILARRLGMESVGIGDVFAPFSPQNAADPKIFLVSQGL